MDDVRKLYTEEQLRQFDDLSQELGDETIRAIERDWVELLGNVRAARGSAPESPEAQALADRWSALLERTMAPYQSKPGLSDAIGEKYRSGKFENFEGAPSSEDFAFIQAALDARKS